MLVKAMRITAQRRPRHRKLLLILITSKKARRDDDPWSFQCTTGMSHVTRMPSLLSWDTLRYTNFAKSIMGDYAFRTTADAWYGHAGTYTRSCVSPHYLKETSVVPGHPVNELGNAQGSLEHNSHDVLLNIQAFGILSRNGVTAGPT